MRSIARCRAVPYSQARALFGGRSAHSTTAAAKASCRASSARSKSPKERNQRGQQVSPLGTAQAIEIGHAKIISGRTSIEPWRAPGIFGGDADGFVEVRGFHEVEAAELFLGLRERPVGGQALALSHAHGGGGVRGLERVATEDGAREFLTERAVFGHFILIVARFPALFLLVDQQ